MSKIIFFTSLTLFCLCLFPNGLVAQNLLDQRLDFSMQNQTIEEGLWDLSKTANIQISFSNNNFTGQTYSFSFRNQTLEYILRQILKETPTTFSVEGNQIFILKKAPIKFTLSGYVEDQKSGERLIGANIYDQVSKKGTTTNAYGFFSLSLKEEHPKLQISYLGYKTKVLSINEPKNQRLNIILQPALTLQEIIVSDKDSLKSFAFENPGDHLAKGKPMEHLPSLGGEVDILRIIQQLPGIQSGTDGLGGLHVRGGNTDQNLVLLDGVPIYNPYHTLGIYSIFDHKTIKNVNYYRGHFPARYGGRVSSVVDVRTKEGNNKEFHAQASIGLIASKIILEGPIKKDKGAFIISARRTHLDPFLKKYSTKQREKENQTGSYNYIFGDILGKFNYTLSQKDKLYLSFYKGKDDYENRKAFTSNLDNTVWSFSEDQSFYWGNTLAVARWNHQFGNKLFSNFTFTHSRFDFNSNERVNDQYSDENFPDNNFFSQSAYRSKIETSTAKTDIDYVPNTAHYLRAGISAAQNTFTPGIANTQDSSFTFYGNLLPDSILNAPIIKGLELNAYLEDEWSVHPNLRLNFGFYSSFFSVQNKNYFLIDPRFSLEWDVLPTFQLNISANKTSQYLHLLTTSGSGFPNDLWVPSTDKIKPQQSKIIDIGLKWRFKKDWSLETNAYYKKMSQLINFIEGANFSSNSNVLNSSNWEDRVTTGSGTSKGLEFLLKKENGKAGGWISYTLSETDRTFPELNSGKAFPFRFDLRHVLNIVSTYKFSEQWSIAATWNYSSGSNISLAFYDWQYIRQSGALDITYLDHGSKNSFQLPANHRLDLSTKFQRKKSWGNLSFDLGVYNAYNRTNIFFIKPSYNPQSNTINYKSVSLIPLLPYFSINIEL